VTRQQPRSNVKESYERAVILYLPVSRSDGPLNTAF